MSSEETSVPEKCISSYRGVSARKGKKSCKWTATIKQHGVKFELGSFDDEISAAKAYDMAYICTHKQEIRQHQLNFPIHSYMSVLPILMESSLETYVSELKAETLYQKKRTQYHGVKLHSCGRWEAWLLPNMQKRNGATNSRGGVYIGLYETDVSAAMAVDQAQMLCYWKAVRKNGLDEPLPKLNFSPEDYYPIFYNAYQLSHVNGRHHSLVPLNDIQIDRVLGKP